MNEEFSIEHTLHHPLDIVLIRSDGKKSSVNLAGQKILSNSQPVQYTHVGLVVSPGLMIHSITSGGVQLEVISRELDAADKWEVIRNRELFEKTRNDSSFHEKALKAAILHLGKRYDFSLGLVGKYTSGSGKSLICSELVAAIYEQLGYTCFTIAERNTYPVHFQTCLESRDWYVATSGYRFVLDDSELRHDHDEISNC